MLATRRAELEARRAAKLSRQCSDDLRERLSLQSSEMRFLPPDQSYALAQKLEDRTRASSTQSEVEAEKHPTHLIDTLRSELRSMGDREFAVFHPYVEVTGAFVLTGVEVSRIAGDWPLEWSHLAFISTDGDDGAILVQDFTDVANGRRPTNLCQIKLWGGLCTSEWEGGPSLNVHTRQGSFLEYGDPDPGGFHHVFCGEHQIKGAVCPSCDNPLLRFFSLDTSDPRLELSTFPHTSLPLLYCWRCGGYQEYQIVGESEIGLLEWRADEPSDDFPYIGYPKAFPGAPARLSPLTDEEQRLIQQMNLGEISWIDVREEHPRIGDLRHQFGGEPYLIQGIESAPICDKCSQLMVLAAVVADDCLDLRGFTENCSVQVLFWLCRGCWTFIVENRCD